MSAAKRSKGKTSFVALPRSVLRSNEYVALSSNAIRLIVDLMDQFYGSNNGSMSPCWTLMRERGWKSTSSLYRAKLELIETGFIIVTSIGKKIRGQPTLIAVTWLGIDEPPIKRRYEEDIKINRIALNSWRKK